MLRLWFSLPERSKRYLAYGLIGFLIGCVCFKLGFDFGSTLAIALFGACFIHTFEARYR